MSRSCSRVRLLLSADLDGEATPRQGAAAHRHAEHCQACHSWFEQAQEVTRRTVVRTATGSPDVADEVIERFRSPNPGLGSRRTWRVRAALALLGLVHLGWAGTGLMGDHNHLGHEMVAFDVAVALGVLAVAQRPWRAGGMLPVLAALSTLLVATSTLDLLDGHTTLPHELPHVLVLLELLVVWRTRWVNGPVGVLPPGPDGLGIGAAPGMGPRTSLDRSTTPPRPAANADRDASPGTGTGTGGGQAPDVA